MLAFTFSRMVPEAVDALADQHYVAVTTFRSNGLGVATPVEFVMQDGSIFFRTLPDSGKVKRLRREPRVLVAACTMRGKVKGHKLAGTAVLLRDEETEALLPEFKAKYGCMWSLVAKLRRPRTQGVRIDLE